MIRTAKLSDLRDLLGIARACAHKLQLQGIDQWNELYPNETTFKKDLGRGELHVLEIAGELIGGLVLSRVMDPEYRSIEWLVPNGNSGYVHRLCVHPLHWGRGHARSLMDHAEALAKEEGFRSVRLDTFSQNRRNQEFYRQRGYQRLGDIYFPQQSPHPFHCYELVLYLAGP